MASVRIYTEARQARGSDTNLGRYASSVDERTRRAANAIGREGVKMAREAAPSGPPRADYARRARVKDSIGYERLGMTRVRWFIKGGQRYAAAAAQETGAGGHIIRGNPLHFFWERQGRWVKTEQVQHPGNPAQPFLQKSYEAMNGGRAVAIARKYFKR